MTHLILYKRDRDGELHGIVAAGAYGEDLYGDLDVWKGTGPFCTLRNR